MAITGAGTSGNPYVIYTFSDLELLGTSPYTLDKYYKLNNDIDASLTSDPGYNSGAGWSPRGTFTGNFNGNNKVISGLYINRPTTDYVGLFSSTSNSAGVVYNLTLSNVNITGQNYVGSVAGYCSSLNQNYITSSGTITGVNKVGGIFGHKYDGGFDHLNSSCTINATTEVGGICGYSYNGTGSYCTFNGTINSNGSYVGGIVGNCYQTVTFAFTTCLFSGTINVSGSGSMIGGIAGKSNNGTLTSCIAFGGSITASSASQIGGIAGSKYAGNFSSCRSFIPVNGGSQTGGILGYVSGNGTMTSCISLSTINGGSSVGGLIGQIYNTGAYNINGGTFTGTINATGSYISPICGYGGSGTFQNITVDSCTINASPTSDYLGGICGYSYSSDYSNCIVETNLSGQTYVGGISGYANDNHSLTQCFYNGNISGNSYLGGILGGHNTSQTSTMSKCYSVGNVSASNQFAGGIAGQSKANATDCGSVASVTCPSYTGGFIGSYAGGTLNKCYSAGLVSGSTNIGGLVGSNSGGTATYSYWDMETSGQTSSPLGSPKFSSEMKRQSTYYSWDFSAIWYIGNEYNNGYPLLRWNNRLGFIDYIDVTHNVASKIYVPYISEVLSRVCVLSEKKDVLSKVIVRAKSFKNASSIVFVVNSIFINSNHDSLSEIIVNTGTTASDVYSIVVVGGVFSKTIEVSGDIVYDHYNSNIASNPNFGVMFGGVYID